MNFPTLKKIEDANLAELEDWYKHLPAPRTSWDDAAFRRIAERLKEMVVSRVVASGFGFYGAAMSVYSHFLARGRDVVYPKDMSMMIGWGRRRSSR